MAQTLAMVYNEHHRMPITTPLAPPRASPPMKSILDACRASPSPSLIDRTVVYIRTSIAIDSPTATLLASANNVRMNLYENKIAPDFPSCSGIAARRDHEAHDSAAAVPPAPLRSEHSAYAPLTTATSVAPRTLPQHTAAAVTFAAAPVAASTAAPVAASTAAPVAASAAAVLPAPLRQKNPVLAPCTCYGSKPGPRAMYLGGFHRPHCAATAAELGPRAMYPGGFHRPHCAATATDLGPRAMCLLRQQHPALAPFTSGTSDSDHSRRSDHDRRDHR